MPSAIWTGSISFGLVQVPVRLVSATRSRDVSFNQLEEGTGARIRYKKVSDATGEEVTARPDQERGYEISKGRYVMVEAEELDVAARRRASHTIEIEEFVDLDEIDPLYFEQPYYLVPDDKGEKPYKLLVDAMSELNKVAIGRIVMRSKERLVAIRPLDGLLCVETMRYADEVSARDGLAPEDVEVEPTARSRWRASSSSRSRPTSSSPRSSTTSTASRCSTSIERKAAGEEIVAEPDGRGAGQGARPRRRARGRSRRPPAPRTVTRARPASRSPTAKKAKAATTATKRGGEGRQGDQGDEDRGQGAGQEDRGPRQALRLTRAPRPRGLADGRRGGAGPAGGGSARDPRLGAVVVVGEVTARGADRLVVLERGPERLADLERKPCRTSGSSWAQCRRGV